MVEDGRPVVTTWSVVRGGPGDHSLTPTKIRNVTVKEIYKGAIRNLGTVAKEDPGDLGIVWPDEGDAAAGDRALRLAHDRRPISDETLQRVAQIVMENKYDPRKQIHDEIGASVRTASRWIAQARSRGYITEEEQAWLPKVASTPPNSPLGQMPLSYTAASDPAPLTTWRQRSRRSR